jgi:acetyl-CoA acetyltransferase
MREAVIVSAVRTPIGNFNGSLSGFGATQLGALVIEEAINRAGITKEDVNEVNMGIVQLDRRQFRPVYHGKQSVSPSTRCVVPV